MVEMKCMTTKQKFEAEDPEVILLKNGKFAYRVKCPWEGKDGKLLHAFKFASRKSYEEYITRNSDEKENAEPEN
jgi:hypothetical protein